MQFSFVFHFHTTFPFQASWTITAVISHTRPPTIFPISKTAFWWTSIKCIHDNNSERSFKNHYFNVSSQSIRVALSSLLDSSINRNWEVRLIKPLEAPFRSTRSRAMFWSSVKSYKQCPTTTTLDWIELNINNNLYYRMNYKNLTANLLRLSLPFYYWQSRLPYGSATGLLCIEFACLVFQPR